MDECKQFDLPSIGLGTFPYKNELINIIPYAHKEGYRLFDTSDNYDNEEYVGKGLEGLEDCVLITKFSQPDRAYEVRRCFEMSTEKLGRRPDIYLLHWPYPFLYKAIWRQMEELYLEGKCTSIGVCNFNVKKLKKLLKVCRIKPSINQVERHPMFQQGEIVDFCVENNIKIISYSPIARQNEKLFSSEILKALATKYGKTINQIILRWNIEKNSIPIPASASENHLTENISVYDFCLSEEDLQKIDELEANMRIRFDPDKRFSRKEIRSFFLYPYKYYIKKCLKALLNKK